MAKDFAGTNRLGHEAGIQAPEAGSNDQLVNKFVKAWESQAARRAVKGGTGTTMALTLAACGSDSSVPTSPVSFNLTPDNFNTVINLASNALGSTVNVADIDGDVYDPVTIEAPGVEADGDTLRFDFNDDNAEDTIVLSATTDVSGYSIYEVVNGTVDFTALGGDVLTDATMSIGSGAILTDAQLTSLNKLALRAGATDANIEVRAGIDTDYAAILEIVSKLEGILTTVAAEAGSLTAEQQQDFQAAGVTVAQVFDLTFSAADGGQFEVNDFNVATDTINLVGLTGVVADTLDDLVGQQGFGGELISIQNNPFDGSQLVNLGVDSSGEIISFELSGITQADLSAVAVSIAGAVDGGDDTADGGADGGDAGEDSGEAVVVVSGSDPVVGTDAAEKFVITVSTTDGGQFEVTNFDVVNDSVNLTGLTGVVADTLADLVGQQGFGGELISIQNDPFAGSQLVNLGFDASGEVVSFELGGVTQEDLSVVSVGIGQDADTGTDGGDTGTDGGDTGTDGGDTGTDGGDTGTDGGDTGTDGGDTGTDGGDTGTDGGDTGTDGGDTGTDGGDTGTDGGQDVLVEVTTDGSVEGTDAAEEFSITLDTTDGGQLVINNFNVANDSLNLSGLTDVVADTLDDLVGQEGFGGELISVQDNPFSGSQFVNLGVDSSGEIISFELGGVTQDDLSAVAVSIA
jgi:hypothetical protein